MRAKNEFRLISEAYDIKLLAEKAVDGTLMCSKDCCGSPVMECKCGDDCKHCNCFMIQKAVKEYGLKSPLLEGAEKFDGPGMQWDGLWDDEPTSDDYDAELPAGHYDTHVRLQRGGRWNAHTVNVRKTDKELIQKFLDQGFRIVKPFDEDNEGHPAGGIRSFRENPPEMDAMAKAALSKDYKHKPYVSFFVDNDGRKVAAVLGSDGKFARDEEGNIKKWPARDKQEAYQWLKDNYENI